MLKEILKEEEEEYKARFEKEDCGGMILAFTKKYNAQIIKAVAEEMEIKPTGKTITRKEKDFNDYINAMTELLVKEVEGK